MVTVEQYLSLHQPITTDPNDVVFLQNGSLAVTVTVTDGDGDQASAPSDQHRRQIELARIDASDGADM